MAINWTNVFNAVVAAGEALIPELVPGSAVPVAAAVGVLNAVKAVAAAPNLDAEQTAQIVATLPTLEAAVNAHAAASEEALGVTAPPA